MLQISQKCNSISERCKNSWVISWTFPCKFCAFTEANPSEEAQEPMHFWIVRLSPEEKERATKCLVSGFLIVRVDEPVKRNRSRGGIRALMKFKHDPAERINCMSTPSVSWSRCYVFSASKTVGALTFPRVVDFRRGQFLWELLTLDPSGFYDNKPLPFLVLIMV